MIDLLVVSRLLLAAVFLVAGLAKIRDTAGTRRAFGELVGGPPSLAPIAAIALPTVEIGTAIALLFDATAWAAAAFAVVLLLVFTAVLLAQFKKDVRPSCPCFGSSRPRAVGPAEVGRNVVLLGLAGWIVGAGRGGAGAGPDVASWIMAGPRSLLVAALALLVGIVVAVILAKRGEVRGTPAQEHTEEIGPQTRRLSIDPPNSGDGLPVGSPAQFQSPRTIPGDTAEPRPTLLLFVSDRFPAGRTLLADAETWEREFAGIVDVELLHAGGDLARRLRVRWTPAALLLDSRSRVAAPVRHGARAIHELIPAIREATHDGSFDGERFARVEGLGLPTGDQALGVEAPDVRLQDAGGVERTLPEVLELGRDRDRAGVPQRDTALMFWDPHCKYCQELAPEIRRYEIDQAHRPQSTAARLVFVTSGPSKAARKAQARFEFTSVSLFDENLALAARFGARGTPAAVLLDAEGRIASAAAMGRDNVAALLGLSTPRPGFAASPDTR